MRTLQYMLDNWDSMEIENKFTAQHERYYRASVGCKHGHPPIRVVGNGGCAICFNRNQQKYDLKANAKKKELRQKEREIKEKKKLEFMEIEAQIIKERMEVEQLTNRCTTLDNLKTGVLYFVKGRCAA